MILALLLGGCMPPHLQAELPQIPLAQGRAWAEAIEVTTAHYRIITNSDQDTAEAIGTLLETVHAACEAMLGPGREHGLLKVYAFTSRKLYEEQITSLHLPRGLSSGIYTPADSPGIYLPLVDTYQTHPFFTLVHEGLHQYLHEAKGFAIHGSPAKLPAAPLWLSEGLALYLEAALVDTNHLQPGRLHLPRLKHLQGLLQNGPAPEVRTVLGATYGEPFANADYSVAWALVHTLRHDPGAASRWASFWTAWQEAAGREAVKFTAQAAGGTPANLLARQEQWAKQLGQLSVQVFQDQVIGTGESWPGWEKRWRASILQLTLEQ